MGQWLVGKSFLWVIMVGLFSFPGPAWATGTGKSLIISAASSLTNVMQSLGKDFEERYPDVNIIFNFGATGALLAQMSMGAPVDIFASASVKHMNQAQEKGLTVSESRTTFAGNTLVLAKPRGSTIVLTGLADLNLDQVERIGIGKPETVPVGQYGKEVLLKAGLWDTLQGKLIFANSARQVLDYLRRGEVDVALIYGTDAKISTKKIETVTSLASSQIQYPIALAKTTHDSEKAMLFLNYLATDSAHTILRSYDFLTP